MQELWRRLETCLAGQSPQAIQSLNPPATEDQIRAAEAKLGFALPSDFADSLRIHNGQARRQRISPIVPAEFGPEGRSSLSLFAEFASLDTILSQTLGNMQAAQFTRGLPGVPDEMRSVVVAAIERGVASGNVIYWMHTYGPAKAELGLPWLIFVEGNGDQLVLDMAPAEGGNAGQVVSVRRFESTLEVLAPDYRTWFTRLVERYESGRYYLIRHRGCLMSYDTMNPKRR